MNARAHAALAVLAFAAVSCSGADEARLRHALQLPPSARSVSFSSSPPRGLFNPGMQREGLRMVGVFQVEPGSFPAAAHWAKMPLPDFVWQLRRPPSELRGKTSGVYHCEVSSLRTPDTNDLVLQPCPAEDELSADRVLSYSVAHFNPRTNEVTAVLQNSY